MSICVVINIFKPKQHTYSSWSTERDHLRSEETHKIPSEIYAERTFLTISETGSEEVVVGLKLSDCVKVVDMSSYDNAACLAVLLLPPVYDKKPWYMQSPHTLGVAPSQ